MNDPRYLAVMLAGAGLVAAAAALAPVRPQSVASDVPQSVSVPTLRHAAGSLGSEGAFGADPGAKFAAEEAAFLARQETVQPERVALPAMPPAAMLPPPDRSRQIGTSIAAIVRSGGSPELILREEGGGFRRLASGGIYRDGWQLKGVAGQTIVLVRGREERIVPIRYGPPDPMEATLQTPVAPVTIARAGPPAGGVTEAALTSEKVSVPTPPRRLIRRPGRS